MLGHLARYATAALVVVAFVVAPGSWADEQRDVTDPIDKDEFLSRISMAHVTEGFADRVEPYSGYLQVNMPVIRLPGRGGQELVIQQYYSSNVWNRVEGTPLTRHAASIDPGDHLGGCGWQLHMGKIYGDLTYYYPSFHPTLVMPDGSTHPLYRSTVHSGEKVTREGWRLKLVGSSWELMLTDGTVYVFNPNAPAAVYSDGHADQMQERVYQCTQIRDVSGNTVDMTYASDAYGPRITQVKFTADNTTDRRVEFGYVSGTANIDWIKVRDDSNAVVQTWDYTYSSSAQLVQLQPDGTSRTVYGLTEIAPPVGNSWGFEYWPSGTTYGNGKHAIKKATLPTGGSVEYTYVGKQFDTGAVCTNMVWFSVTSQRVAKDRSAATIGTWTWDYQDNSAVVPGQENARTKLTVTVGTDEVQTETTTFHGWVGSDNDMWRVGLPKLRITTTKQSSQPLETVTSTYTWTEGGSLSDDDIVTSGWDGCATMLTEGYVKAVKPTTITTQTTRGSRSWTTTSSNFDDYQNVGTITETSSHDGLSRTTQLQYFSNDTYNIHVGHPTCRDPDVGGLEAHGYDTVGRLTVTRVNPSSCTNTSSGVETRFQYDSYGNLTKQFVENGTYDGETTYSNFRYGVPELITKENGSSDIVIDRDVNVLGALTSETDGRGTSDSYRTYYYYDALNRLTKIEPPIDNTEDTTLTYATDGSLVTVRRTNDNHQLLYAFDGLARLTRRTEQHKPSSAWLEMNSVSIGYNPLGVATSKALTIGTSPADTYLYDQIGRLTRVNHPDSRFVSYAYTYSGSEHKVTETDENSRPTYYHYKAFGAPDDRRLTQVTDAASQSWSYLYDSTKGLLTKVDQPGSADRTFTYTSPELFLDTETHPETGVIDYAYDRRGDVTQRTKGSQTTTYEYDRVARLTKANYPDSSPDETYQYDGAGNRTSMVSTSGSFTYEYDYNRRLTKKRSQISGTNYDLVYHYDTLDRLTQLDYPLSGTQVKYQYDSRSWATKVSPASGTDYVSTVAYHPSGAPQVVTFGNAVATTYGQDTRFRVSSIDTVKGATPLLDLGFQYDGVSNLTTWTDNLGAADRTFGYDPLNRLTLANAAGLWGNLSYTYDALGNRTTAVSGAGTTTYSYDMSHSRLTSVSGGGQSGTYTYDTAGRMTTAVLPDTAAPGPVTQVSASGSGTTSVSLSWHNPSDPDFVRVKVYRDDAGYPAPGSVSPVYTGNGTSFTDTGLSLGVRYFYTLVAEDEVPNYSEPAYASARAGACTACDLDLMVGVSTGGVKGVVNTGTTTIPAWQTLPTWDLTADSSAAPALGDLDNDGDTDMIVCDQGQYCDAYRNIGSMQVPTWQTMSGWNLTTMVGLNTAPALADLDRDGDLDLVVGLSDGTCRFWENQGDATAPIWVEITATWSVGLTDIGQRAMPTLADLDGDSDLDMLLGRTGASTAAAFENVGDPWAPQWQPRSGWNSPSVAGTHAAPTLADLDTDGRPDLLMCTYNTGCSAYRNTGSAGPVWTSQGSWNVPASVGQYAIASAADLDREYATLTINDVTVTEGSSGTVNANFTVTLSPASGQQVTVHWATADGTATQPADYTAGFGDLTFTSGQTTRPVTVQVKGDLLNEADEAFTVNLSAAVNASIGDSQGVGTILNDDPLPSLAINDVSVTEGNFGTVNANFTVVLSAASGRVVTVHWATANGTATQPADYTAGFGDLTFISGETLQPVTVQVKGDLLNEADETFFVNLSSPVYADISDSQGVGVILNDDPVPTLSINDVSVVEGNKGTVNAVFTVTLSAASGQQVAVHWATADGTATQPADYTAGSGDLTYTSGQTTKTVTVAVKGDTLDEPDETFFVNLSAAVYAIIADSQGVGTIVDDDPTPSLSVNDVSVVEGHTGTVDASFTVTLSAASGRTVTVHWATADGTATQPADYTAGFGDLTFTSGQTTRPVTVAVKGDTLDEPNETFFVNLSAAVNATIADSQGVGTIVDDDPTPTLSVNDVSVVEGDSGTVNANFTVTLSAASGRTVTVNWATADGTATQPADYTAGSGGLTFAPDEPTTRTVTVQVKGDLLNEADETFTVNLSAAVNATISDSQGVGTITNDDPLPSLSVDDISVTEGNVGTVNANFTLTLSAASGRTVTVHYATADGTATQPADYTAGSANLDFSPGQTTKPLPVSVNGDLSNEPDELFYVNLSGEVNATIADGQGVCTILDDGDPPPTVAWSSADFPVAEGVGLLQVTAVLSVASDFPVTVDLAAADGTATWPDDYGDHSSQLTIPADHPSEDFTVAAIVDDHLYEGDETYTLTLSNPVNATLGSPSTATVTIVDDDNLAPNPGFEEAGVGWTASRAAAYPGTSLARVGWGSASPHSGAYAYAISNQAYGILRSNPIPVTSGTQYDLYAWARGYVQPRQSGTSYQICAQYYDAQGTLLQSEYATYGAEGPVGATADEWAYVGGRVTPVAGTATLRVELRLVQANGWVGFDEVSLVDVEDTGTNLVEDPSFEDGSGWTAVAKVAYPATALLRADWGTSEPHKGNYAYSISNLAYGTLQSDPITVSATAEYDLFAWARGYVEPDSSGTSYQIWVEYFGALGESLGGQYAKYGPEGPVGATPEEWAYLGGRIKTVAGTHTLRISLRLVQADGWVAFDDIWLCAYPCSGFNLAPDPGFELGVGWTALPTYPGTSFFRASWGTSTPHGGSWAYSISNQAYGSLTSDAIAVAPSTDYDLYSWARGYVNRAESGSAYQIRAEYYDEEGSSLGGQYAKYGAPGPVGGTADDWAWLGGRITTPAATASMRVVLRIVQANGWVAFDDVVLAEEIARLKAVLEEGNLSSDLESAETEVPLQDLLLPPPPDLETTEPAVQVDDDPESWVPVPDFDLSEGGTDARSTFGRGGGAGAPGSGLGGADWEGPAVQLACMPRSPRLDLHRYLRHPSGCGW